MSILWQSKGYTMIDVVALGELLIDFTCVSTDADGYPTMAAHAGGAPVNFLAALAKYGAKAALLGKVGADTFGKLLLQTLQKAGIETKGMVATEEQVPRDTTAGRVMCWNITLMAPLPPPAMAPIYRI